MSGQAEIVAFLEKPDSYPHRPKSVERIDTHAALIFLAGERAYKLKRAITLSYLDFSTLENRRVACERELRLNRKTAPEIYLQLLAIYRDEAGHLHLGGDSKGEAADFVVEMSRFDQNQLLDELARAGHLEPPLIEKLALTVQDFHAKAPSIPRASWPKSLIQVVGTVKQALAHKEFAHLDPGAAIDALDAALSECGPYMEERRMGGFVRHCHGDLHLKNIVLIDSEPRLFDALEFDEELATIDILYDLAFLLMDLWHRGLHGEANAVLNHYFARKSGRAEWAGLKLLPLFMAIRAGVRAMVGLDALSVVNENKDRDRLRDEMLGYAGLFKRLIAPPPPRFIAIGGLSGTGKTTVARALASKFGAAPGAIHLRSDVERKTLFRAGLYEALAATCYTRAATQMVYQRIYAKAEMILRAGHSVILDATFVKQEDRDALTSLAERCGVTLEAIWLQAEEEQMIGRAGARQHDASDAKGAVVREQLKKSGTACPEGWRPVDARGARDNTIRNASDVLGL